MQSCEYSVASVDFKVFTAKQKISLDKKPHVSKTTFYTMPLFI